MEARQLGNNVLGQTVREEFLLWIAAHIRERQHGDRGHSRRSLRLCRAGGRALRVEQHAKHADRPADVLDAVLAEILERDIEPVADLVADGGGDVDAARLGERL